MTIAKKTEPELEALLARAQAAPPMTEAEVQAQRGSWVRGEKGMGTDKDEAAYKTKQSEGE